MIFFIHSIDSKIGASLGSLGSGELYESSFMNQDNLIYGSIWVSSPYLSKIHLGLLVDSVKE